MVAAGNGIVIGVGAIVSRSVAGAEVVAVRRRNPTPKSRFMPPGGNRSHPRRSLRSLILFTRFCIPTGIEEPGMAR